MKMIEFEKFISRHELNLFMYKDINEYLEVISDIIVNTMLPYEPTGTCEHEEIVISKVLAIAEVFWNQYIYSGISLFKKGIASFLEKAQDSESHNDWMNVYIYSLEYIRFAYLS